MDPVAFNIGDFSIRWYGILIGLGALVGMLLAYYNAKKLKLDPAIMAAPLITTLVDVCSILVYFQIATTIMGL